MMIPLPAVAPQPRLTENVSTASTGAPRRLIGVSVKRVGIAVALRCCVVGALCMFGGMARAELAEQLRNLPDEQRQALIESVRRGDAADVGILATPTVNEPAQPAPRAAPVTNGTTPTLGSDSTVLVEVIGVTRLPGDDEPENQLLAAAARKIPQGNPYRLDPSGQLQLPGYPAITLNGLSAQQATQLLDNYPALRGLQLRVTLLPLVTDAAKALLPFGYEMFEDAAGAFAPPVNAPVPADYRLGPGDTLRLSLVGQTNRQFNLEIDRNGEVHVQDIGPVVVAGMRFEEAKAALERKISERVVGVQASVAMGQLRTIRVFILGEAKQPGSYVVSGLSTVSNALVLGGGVARVGSLRNVQLKRQGRTVATLDLYDMLLRGDTSGDRILEPGDVIFIPPVGATAGISGAVRRQGIYELRVGQPAGLSVDTLIRLAGGTSPDADPAMAVVERINEARRRVVLNVDLRGTAARSFRLRAGDLVRIPVVRPTFAQDLRMEGHVHRPGAIGFVRGMRLADALQSVDDLKADADLHYVVIRREVPPDRHVRVLSADLAAAWANPEGRQNVKLVARDRVIVFDLRSDRSRVIQPLLEELQRQSSVSAPAPVASVRGIVKAPGDYPLEPNMRVSDLLRAGGGLGDGAYTGNAEIARYAVIDGERREVELIKVDLRAVQAGNAAADVKLAPFDLMIVKEVPQWDSAEIITLGGEVRFPGEYPIRRGETLRSMIERAGGFTERAFPDGSIFTRAELRRREQQQLDDLGERMRRELAIVALRANNSATTGVTQPAVAGAAVVTGQALLDQVKSARAVGRLVIDLPGIMHGNGKHATESDIYVRQGDSLVVPRLSQEVTVIGEVQNPSSYVYHANMRRDDYIRISGGTTVHADRGRTYVIRANGLVEASRGGAWFARAATSEIRAGDAIVVPLDVDRQLSLPLWTSVSTILYNIAIAVAAVRSF